MDRKDIDQQSKNEFSNKVNEQAGRTSLNWLETVKYMTKDQQVSWNESGYILIPNFVEESFCNDMNNEVTNIIKSIIPEDSAFSHAYAGDGHIAIREMKPSPDAKNIEDEISKLFRIHSRGIFNTFINNKNLCDVLEIPEILSDERFNTNSLRCENMNQLKEIFENKLSTKKTEEWIKEMEQLKIPCGPIFNIKQAVENPQIQERNMIVNSFHKVIGNFKSAGNPIKLSTYKDETTRGDIPDLDEHREKILKEFS